MDREKQIEEIYEEIKYGRSVAEILYDIGYRKQSEVAKEIFEKIITTIFSKMPSDILLVGKDCDFEDGIRMGKREAIFDMINTLAELKRKYTEESGNDR